MNHPTAIIADDEKQLRIDLVRKLGRIWPELRICGEAENGPEAVALIKEKAPDIALLDIRMPGFSGIEVASRTAGQCRIVFITAYDQYAIEAFENEAIDYLLKPVETRRLEKTINRLKRSLDVPDPMPDVSKTLTRLLSSLNPKPAESGLRWINARHGDEILLIPVDEVCYFKSEDKYTVVRTTQKEFLIRKTIASLSESLDPEQFRRIHRGVIVNMQQIAGITRSFTGNLHITLKDLPETLAVSRTYAHQFRQM